MEEIFYFKAYSLESYSSYCLSNKALSEISQNSRKIACV